jgi:hypothetical protein
LAIGVVASKSQPASFIITVSLAHHAGAADQRIKDQRRTLLDDLKAFAIDGSFSSSCTQSWSI